MSGVAALFVAPFLAAVIYAQLAPDPWTTSVLGQPLVLETDGGRYAWYESASFDSAFELVSETGLSIELTETTSSSRTEDGRTYLQFAETNLEPGVYELRTTPSAFATSDALVAYSISPTERTESVAGASALGFLLGGAAFVIIGIGTVANLFN